jgi:hypothetical protein
MANTLCEREYCTTVSAANTDPSVSCVRYQFVLVLGLSYVAGLSQGLRRNGKYAMANKIYVVVSKVMS